jgi:putative colanic acid biosynthesis acetyltransferase WcaF
MPIDVSKASCPSAHSFQNKLGRVLWGMVWLLLFRTSPRLCYAWRTMLLRTFGARIGRNARVSPAARIWAPWNLTLGDEVAIAHGVDCYCVDAITIGSHATVSQYAFLCTASHDIGDPHMRLTTAPIVIDGQAWVCAGAFIGPGVILGEGAVAGAMAVVTRSVAPWDVVAGNPARVIKRRVLHDAERDTVV